MIECAALFLYKTKRPAYDADNKYAHNPRYIYERDIHSFTFRDGRYCMNV
jgi:hypothetical protein